jgi:non-ribosomal peptide synthetase component E (peptide arylation enzyme)
VDDVINVSGHRIGTAEVESALTAHEECVEAAVIGCVADVAALLGNLVCGHAAWGEQTLRPVKGCAGGWCDAEW